MQSQPRKGHPCKLITREERYIYRMCCRFPRISWGAIDIANKSFSARLKDTSAVVVYIKNFFELFQATNFRFGVEAAMSSKRYVVNGAIFHISDSSLRRVSAVRDSIFRYMRGFEVRIATRSDFINIYKFTVSGPMATGHTEKPIKN